MAKFVINGESKLFGKVEICSSKNAILPLIAASVLSSGKVVLNNIPQFSDVENMLQILKSLGAKVKFENRCIEIDPTTITTTVVPEQLSAPIRASFFCLGAMLGKFHNAQISYPGGCKIGTRPIDLHLLGLKELGANICEHNGRFFCETTGLKASTVNFSFPSVGATENVLMASVMAKGKTVILNPAREPEIVYLANFLNKMGAKVVGAGSEKIKIEGVEQLCGVEYTPIPDRIVAGTFVIAVATVGGKVALTNVKPKHIQPLLVKLKKYSCQITQKNDTIVVESKDRPICIPQIKTKPYPGFPTDLQSQIMALQSISLGRSVITENLYETRFGVAEQLLKLGAKINVCKNKAIVYGVPNLIGANVQATDLRAGAALVIAAMKAKGQSVISDVENIDRGYESFENQLNSICADILRK